MYPVEPIEAALLSAASAAEPKISEKLIWKISLSSASVNCGVDLDDVADTADGILDAAGSRSADGGDYFNALVSILSRWNGIGDLALRNLGRTA